MKRIGSTTKVKFPQFDNLSFTARVDTGAYSGSLYCTDFYIKKVKGLYVLYFKPYGQNQYYSTERYRVLTVRSSNGHEQQRFSIKTEITIKKETYEIRLTLADRISMRYPVLVGRRFLRQHSFVVDPAGVLRKKR